MQITQLILHNFRNYTHQDLSFGNGVNILLGENAQGKTNALEAVYCLAVGKSHRTRHDADLVRWGENESKVTAHVLFDNGRQLEFCIEYQPTGKKALVNGILQAKMTEFIGHFQVVLFAPEDLQLVKGSPAGRRRFLDMELGQTQAAYLHHLSRYLRALQQRNRLLKSHAPQDPAMLDAFDGQLAEHGAELWHRRFAFVSDLRDPARTLHESVASGRERLTIRYACAVKGVSEETDLASLRGLLQESLAARRGSDLQTGFTSVGPHRDDLDLLLDNQPLQSFASQGQQRTVALSVRLAELDVIRREVGEYPVLLLDDVLSELDDARQRNLVLAMTEKVQTLLTTTSLFQLSGPLADRSRLFHVQSGIIVAEG